MTLLENCAARMCLRKPSSITSTDLPFNAGPDSRHAGRSRCDQAREHGQPHRTLRPADQSRCGCRQGWTNGGFHSPARPVRDEAAEKLEVPRAGTNSAVGSAAWRSGVVAGGGRTGCGWPRGWMAGGVVRRPRGLLRFNGGGQDRLPRPVGGLVRGVVDLVQLATRLFREWILRVGRGTAETFLGASRSPMSCR